MLLTTPNRATAQDRHEYQRAFLAAKLALLLRFAVTTSRQQVQQKKEERYY